MSEDVSRNLTTEDLVDMLTKSTKELADIINKDGNKTEYENKRHEIQLLQRIIIAKRAEHKPGPALL